MRKYGDSRGGLCNASYDPFVLARAYKSCSNGYDLHSKVDFGSLKRTASALLEKASAFAMVEVWVCQCMGLCSQAKHSRERQRPVVFLTVSDYSSR